MVDSVSPRARVVIAMSSVGGKGRVLIPSDVRQAAQLEEGDEVILRVEGPGRVVIESREALRDRVWASAPSSEGIDPAEDLRAVRQMDVAISDRADARRRSTDPANAEQVGARLLNVLGVE